jgi:hypothetical protein
MSGLPPAAVSLSAVAAAPARDVASTIIAMERAALDRSDQLDVGGFLEISDPGVVYFDPFIEEPIHGLDALRTYYQGFAGQGAPGTGEMLHAQVQVHGEVAVLTFNYRRTDGTGPRWHCTEAYVRRPAGWRIVQTHWSIITLESKA